MLYICRKQLNYNDSLLKLKISQLLQSFVNSEYNFTFMIKNLILSVLIESKDYLFLNPKKELTQI